EALIDPDEDAIRDVLSGRERRARLRVVAGADIEPVEPERTAKPVEDAGAAARERGCGLGELKPLRRRELTGFAAEEHAREDLVLGKLRGRAQAQGGRRRGSAEDGLCRYACRLSLRDDVEPRIDSIAAVERDLAMPEG